MIYVSFSEAQILKKRSSDFLEESKHLIDIKNTIWLFLTWNNIAN